MKIPVFVSSPTRLNPRQQQTRVAIFGALAGFGLEARALGQSDYPTQLPLREVLVIARRCAGALVLGYEQQFASHVEVRRGLPDGEGSGVLADVAYPTPWNQLEAGILVSLSLPMLVFREPSISGGIFDHGVSDSFVHPMPVLEADQRLPQPVIEVFLKWQAEVRQFYYA